VTISPYVMAEADEATGSREPPADAGAGRVRLLERPLWGKREVWVRTAPSFVPRKELYRGLRYQAPAADDLTKREGAKVGEFVKAAKAAGLKVYMQVQAAIPPGYRVQFGGPTLDDVPLLPNGKEASRRLAQNGSLASRNILDYEHALIRDLVTQYPDIDGIRFDWPEYPPYFLDAAFFDFCGHARTAALREGFNFDQMKRDVGLLYENLHGGLTNEMLRRWVSPDGGRYALLRLVSDFPGVAEFIRFKATLVERMIQGFRHVMDEAGGEDMELMPNASPPPWTIVSGMDFRRVARYSSAISVKLYTMHWPMMLRFYGDQLMEKNPGLDGALLTEALVQFLDITDNGGLPGLEDYHYPGPEEAHPVGAEAQKRKIATAQAEAGETPVLVLAHGYGPLDDFNRRLKLVADSPADGAWINRYGYISDEKLDVIGSIWR
jgi:hypothetical protein